MLFEIGTHSEDETAHHPDVDLRAERRTCKYHFVRRDGTPCQDLPKGGPDLQTGGHVGGAVPAENDDGKDGNAGKQGIVEQAFPAVRHRRAINPPHRNKHSTDRKQNNQTSLKYRIHFRPLPA